MQGSTSRIFRASYKETDEAGLVNPDGSVMCGGCGETFDPRGLNHHWQYCTRDDGCFDQADQMTFDHPSAATEEPSLHQAVDQHDPHDDAGQWDMGGVQPESSSSPGSPIDMCQDEEEEEEDDTSVSYTSGNDQDQEVGREDFGSPMLQGM